jgi:hypothetical protein
VEDFNREHSDWSALFDARFLTTASPILAGVLMRDPEPGAAALAAAWVNQLPAGERNPQRLEQAVSIAAEFLVTFDLALRRQDVFRQHFDSQALDSTARFLGELLPYVRALWIQQRGSEVNKALRRLGGAAVRYQEAAGSRRGGSQIPIAQIIVDAKLARWEAEFMLSRLGYSEVERLRTLFKELVDEPYSSLTFATHEEGVAFDAGIEEFLRALTAAPPL